MKKAAESKNPMTRKALRALREAVAGVVEENRREGRPLAVWQDGKAVLVSLPKKGASSKVSGANAAEPCHSL